MSQENNKITLMLMAGIAGMLMLFISLLLVFIFTQRKKLQYRLNLQALQNAQKNQLIEAAVRSEEIERHRIAEELHDEVGAILGSSSLHFYGINIEDCDEISKEMYQKGKNLLDEGIHKIRGISHNLHSSILQELGLKEAISHFCGKISHNSIVKIDLNLTDQHHTKASRNDISIYRIIQELIHNITKHAKANFIHIQSASVSNHLVFTISHNGNGLTQDQFEKLRFIKDGLGLKNIQNRMILLRAELRFWHHLDKYFIEIKVPVE
ncbi:sensor histidine kinase [Pedobacter sp. UBA5917]|jgi:signal transduction histidine kinase|uniref:sensor histidine kinase n=1 Tax=Pedobacter sp. UBA5917 TaxID=1947061 RepID=UPI0025D6F212|nr:histidine kinase [Pedobacter sp. UBA5917]